MDPDDWYTLKAEEEKCFEEWAQTYYGMSAEEYRERNLYTEDHDEA